METLDLYREAQDADIPIIPLDIPENGSMCIQTPIRCYIGVDHSVLEDDASIRVHLGHELGHCKTGSFYNIWAAQDVRQKHENQADRWVVEHLITADELDAAVADGYTNEWDLAEYFDVTPDFVRKAVCYYTYGNLATELYF